MINIFIWGCGGDGGN